MTEKGKNLVLAVNIGSTSTKTALYDGKICLWSETRRHRPEDIKPEEPIFSQLDMRFDAVQSAMAQHGCRASDLALTIAPAGLLPPTKKTRITAGAYAVSETLLRALRDHPLEPHPVNMGPYICRKLADEGGGLAVAYDATTIDEMDPVLKITGFPAIERKARGHNLNERTIAMQYCEQAGLDYRMQNLIIAHLGGGSTVALHRHGQIADMISDDIQQFSPTRCGGVPAYDLARYVKATSLNTEELLALMNRKSGLYGHLGTTDIREVEKRIAAGDEKAAMVLEAMCIGVAKAIGELATVVCGQVDQILLTGGIANSHLVTEQIVKRVSFLAPVRVMPGENEMLGLAMGAERLLQGRETIKEYV
jgi:butyrate kinase